MIRFANEKDLKEILDLWSLCFPGEEPFKEYFFTHVFDINTTLVFMKDAQIVGMLQMIPYQTNQGEVTYIYGACTKPNYRKQGIMELLLTKSFEISKQKGQRYSILIPQEPWLFGFYAKYGYQQGLDIFQSEILVSHTSDVMVQTANEADIPDMLDLYQQQMSNQPFYIKRQAIYYKKQCSLYGDGAVKYLKDGLMIGYSFGVNQDDQVLLDEILSTNLEFCFGAYPHKKVIYKTNGVGTNLGMIKSLVDVNPPSGYINLMFN